jgi:hypothetical protein
VPGLLLQVRPPVSPDSPQSRSWVLRVRVAGRRQVIGLGPYPQVTLAEAREAARRLVADARGGVDLLARKQAQRSAIADAYSKQKTFIACVVNGNVKLTLNRPGFCGGCLV